jgi:PilZ domain
MFDGGDPPSEGRGGLKRSAKLVDGGPKERWTLPMSVQSGVSGNFAGAATALVTTSVIDVVTDRGDEIELWTISSDGEMVTASGPRLQVASGMHLTCRLVGDRGVLTVAAVIESAEYRSPSRASLTLRVVDVAIEQYQRRAARLSVRAPATLRAMVCDRVVPGESIAMTMTDLSESGVGLTTNDDRLRAGDRFRFTSRFLEGAISGEVRVAYVAQSSTPGVLIAGCFFLDRAPVADVINRVLARLGGDSRPAPDSVRDVLMPSDVPGAADRRSDRWHAHRPVTS